MTVFSAESFDVAVIGAGHAGIEAALAAARLGAKTACFSINLDAVGNMPCNPAIGGTAKGHLVREIDALGGEMARAADAACIQYRMLNRGKGPAVHSLRAQADRIKYREYMKHTLERQENLFLMQDEIVSIEVENGAVSAVVTAIGARHPVKAAVIASGTFLGGRVIIGEYTRESGPDGMAAAKPLTESLRGLGLRLQRFKTGTPPRINRRSINYTDLAEQAGEDEIIPFSFETDHPPDNRAVCYLTYTTAKTHEIIRANLSRSPLYGGQIEAWDRAIVRLSRTKWCALRISHATSCSLSRWVWTPRRSMCRASRRPCRSTCSARCCARSRDWRTRRLCGRRTPSSMTASTAGAAADARDEKGARTVRRRPVLRLVRL